MKTTTTPLNVTNHRTNTPLPTAEEKLNQRIFSSDDGKNLIKFCRELSTILIRSYSPKNGAGELREKLTASLMVTLKCTEKQALSLVELALELIHAKLNGTYRRTEVELSYLIATATGAVGDVSSN